MATRKTITYLAVKDLKLSKEFFEKLGFAFSTKFSDEKAELMTMNSESSVMLLTEPFFKTFASKEICDTASHHESMIAFMVDSREEVDEIVNKAFAAGGTPALPSKDHGMVYVWSFHDLDGHHWKAIWMDPSMVMA